MHKLVLALPAAVAVAALLAASASGRHSATNGPIAFDAKVGSLYEVFTINPDGTGLKQVTHGRPEAGQYGLAWSPDGSSLLYQVPGKGYDILEKANADGSDAAPWSPPCTGQCLGDDYPEYNAGGTKVVYDRAYGPVKTIYGAGEARVVAIFMANADGTDPTQLTMKHSVPYGAGDQRPVWSPDGTKIAFWRQPPTTKAGQPPGAIWLMNANGSDQHRLTPVALDAIEPHWSTNGTIVFSSNGAFLKGKDANVYSIRPDGSSLKQLTHYGGGLQAIVKDVSPDGTEILFHLRVANEYGPGRNQLYVMNADGSGARQLTHMPPRSDPGGGSARWAAGS